MEQAKSEPFIKPELLINCRGRLMDFTRPKVMGIVNLTPDSFYDGGKNQDQESMISLIDRHVMEGVDILDFGACSTRPGAEMITAEEEWKRLQPGLHYARNTYPEAIISVDTYQSEVANKAADKYSVDIINDVSAGNLDKEMIPLVADLKLPFIVMHMPGNPQTMQKNTLYEDVALDIMRFFVDKIEECRLAGIQDVIIDPGFGFGKTIEQNYRLLNKLDQFRIFERPVLAGISRKSMIWKLLGIKPSEALTGTTALHLKTLEKGANILRVHDVREAKETITIFEKLKDTVA